MPLKTNGEYVSLADSPAQRADTTEDWELEGQAGAWHYVTVLGETDPAGRFRIGLTADYLLIQRKGAAGEAGWATPTEIVRLSATGLSILTGTAIGAEAGEILSRRGAIALMVVRIASAVQDGETVDLGDDKYEFFTEDAEALDNAGAIGVDVSGGSTVKSQGTLTMDTQPTPTDTVTIGVGAGEKVYTWVASGAASEGEINVGADLAAAKVNFVAAVNGTDGWNTAHTQVTAAAFSGDDCVLTAIKGGTFGDTIATTETFTEGTNVFDDATLGTTTAGVDPTAAEASDALIAAINASATEAVRAVDIGANEVLVLRTTAGVNTDAAAEDMGGANNAVAAAAFFGGQAAAAGKLALASRVPTATEVALGNMHFGLDFDPVFVQVLVTVTSSGLQKAWDGLVTIVPAAGDDPAYVTVDNSGSTDWAATDTVRIAALA